MCFINIVFCVKKLFVSLFLFFVIEMKWIFNWWHWIQPWINPGQWTNTAPSLLLLHFAPFLAFFFFLFFIGILKAYLVAAVLYNSYFGSSWIQWQMVKTENKNEQKKKKKNPLKPFSFRLSLKRKLKYLSKHKSFFKKKNYPKKNWKLKNKKKSLRNENKVSNPLGSF